MSQYSTNTPIIKSYPTEYAAFKRIRWGAVFAGALVALVCMIALNMLGLGVGFASINPTTEANPFSGIGTGAIIWYVVATLISLFTGGYVAGRLSGMPKKSNAGLHGILSWCLVTLVTLWLFTTTMGRVVSGVGSAISSVTGGVVNTVGAVVPNNLDNKIGDLISQEINLNNVNLNKVRAEVFALLEDADKAALDPDNLKEDYQEIKSSARSNAQDVKNNPFSAGNDVNQVIDRIQAKGGNVLEAMDKDALVNVITARTELSEAEARKEVNRISRELEQTAATVRQDVRQFANRAAETAEEVGGSVADGLATAAILGFVALLLGALVSFFGGQTGRQTDLTLAGNGPSVAATEADRK